MYKMCTKEKCKVALFTHRAVTLLSNRLSCTQGRRGVFPSQLQAIDWRNCVCTHTHNSSVTLLYILKLLKVFISKWFSLVLTWGRKESGKGYVVHFGWRNSRSKQESTVALQNKIHLVPFFSFFFLSQALLFFSCVPTLCLSYVLSPSVTSPAPLRPFFFFSSQIRPVKLQAAGLVNWNGRVWRPEQWCLCFLPKTLQAPRQPHTCCWVHTRSHTQT